MSQEILTPTPPISKMAFTCQLPTLALQVRTVYLEPIVVKDKRSRLISSKCETNCTSVCSRFQLDPGAAGQCRVPVLFQPRGEHLLPGGLRPQPEPHVLRLHRNIEQYWSKACFTTYCSAVEIIHSHPITLIYFWLSYKMWVAQQKHNHLERSWTVLAGRWRNQQDETESVVTSITKILTLED